MSEKIRLDVLLAQRDLAPSREAARRLIMAGEVRVDGEIRDKPGMKVSDDAEIEVQQAPRFVSRGGEKLLGAFEAFAAAGLSVEEAICADVGASTGGFTDCLLQHGAAKVYAIDVGYGQLDYRLRSDERVVVMERTNARHLASLPEPVAWIVADTSFISLRYLLPVFRGWFSDNEAGQLVVLIKPQFEAGKAHVGKGGVVRDPDTHYRVLVEVLTAAVRERYTVRGLAPSPLKGPSGNVEFLAWLAVGEAEALALNDLILPVMAAIHPDWSPVDPQEFPHKPDSPAPLRGEGAGG
ncbi:MAG: TlyA family RNA methyltransferase [Anaerolineae bacterium]|nr:TlyA family RNA methyltransferase [Anaerolineae bacterium]